MDELGSNLHRKTILTQEKIDELYGYRHLESSMSKEIRQNARRLCAKVTSPLWLFNKIIGMIPILRVIPKYNLKSDLIGDIVGGLTTGILQVPQGIAFATVAGVKPVYGLYSSFFPVIFYMIFGTSRHCSLGSFAVVSIMAGITNDRIREEWAHSHNLTDIDDPMNISPIIISSALAFSVGIIELITGLLHLNFITMYFSDQLVAGFTAGSACHVFMAQMSDVLGVKLPKNKGPGYIFVTLKDVILSIPHANICAVVISACGIIFLYCGKEFISPFLRRHFNITIPIPYELFLVIITDLVSYLGSFETRYSLDIVKEIPTGYNFNFNY
ncbi:hypothetical protein AB6A40_008257 [Gnathostoma spinigerum]|uniref:SLC26A/SulP transporter domain-containing protein n=1 Tax=Gnathostoma spinigerum TaxID=75299 RepID=A0ABD6ENK0_9BILA